MLNGLDLLVVDSHHLGLHSSLGHSPTKLSHLSLKCSEGQEGRRRLLGWTLDFWLYGCSF